MLKHSRAIAAAVLHVGLCAPLLSAQQTPAPKAAAVVVSAPPVQAVTPPAYAEPKSGLTPAQQKGQRIFQQRCTVCHTPGKPTNRQVGPRLIKEQIVGHEDTIRQFIMAGSRNMPGFKDGLSADQIDAVVEYLKTGLGTPAVDQVGPLGRGDADINRRD